ncbi:piercer of microtubule wall 2 protein-like [Corticium candelabrum]|uniref:piercer of microtubule wall 2 protein-like n=1 Tax=Corticium candelabrum TaxID=121492 RepID=UPI002E262E48|nr:piercer of microtubule wall 2 protein-like [Corticium candelabrum]
MAQLPVNPIFNFSWHALTLGDRKLDDNERDRKLNMFMYNISSSSYGEKVYKPPTETLPCSFHGKSNEFSEHLRKIGMYRDYSMNMRKDSSRV